MCDSGVSSHSRESSVSVQSNESGAGVVLSVSGLTRRPVTSDSCVKDSPRSEDSGVATTGDNVSISSNDQSCDLRPCDMGQVSSAPGNDDASMSDMVRLEPEGINEEDDSQTFTSFLSVDKRLFGRLQEELTQAQSQLKLKEEQVIKLSRIRDDVEREMEDLTASLFQVNSITIMLDLTNKQLCS